MTDTDEDMKIQKITKLLEKGGTMLANHHECGSPMFRYQGKVICPVCEGQTEHEKPGVRSEMHKPEKPEEQKKSNISDSNISNDNISNIYVQLMDKIKEISESLESETDLQRVKSKLECIELGVKILKSLEDKWCVPDM